MGLNPDLPNYDVNAALTRVDTPIYALQELAVKNKHDGMLFHDAYFDREGKLHARWGGGEHPCDPGDFFAPHGIWVDSRGDLYVSEVALAGGAV